MLPVAISHTRTVLSLEAEKILLPSGLKVTGILLCMYDKHVILSSEVKADIEQFLAKARETDCPWSGARIIPVHVRRNIKLAEAPSYGKTIFEYEPKCHGAEDYRTVAEYIHSQTGAEPKGQAEPVVVSEGESVGGAAKKV